MPAVEHYGIEPIPAELRTAGWRDLFAVNFTFFLNPVMYVLGALAVLEGGLPLPWAIAAMVAGQALAFGFLVVVARPGVDDGLPGQVAMRATFGILGARLATSPYRMVAATYWFAAQSLTGALGFQAIVDAMSGHRLPLVPTAVGLGVFYAALALLGFDVMRWLLKIVLPLSLGAAAVLVTLFVTSDDPRYAPARVWESPDQSLTWVGFATFVTVMCGSSLTLVTNVADVCRYTPTRRDMQVGLVASALLTAVATTFVGGYVAAASGDTNPFVAAAGLTSSDVVLAGLLVAIVVQTVAANLTNVYTAGLSLVNSLPRARPPARDGDRRGGGGDPVGVPVVHRGGARLGHAPRERRRAADRRRARRLPHRAARPDRRPRRSSTPRGAIATAAASTSRPCSGSRPEWPRTTACRTAP